MHSRSAVGSHNNGFRKSKNIIVLLLDTMRASDAYGNSKLKNLGNLASKGMCYTNAISPATWTVPSHASIFTERRPSEIKQASRNFFSDSSIDPWIVKAKFLPDNSKTLASKMHEIGYYSTLFSNNPFLTSNTNLAIGFDKVYDLWLKSNIKYNPKKAKILANFINGEKARKALFSTALGISKIIPDSIMNRLYINLRVKMAEGVAKSDGTYYMDRGAVDTNAALRSYLEKQYNYMPQFMFINCIEAHENYPIRDKEIVQDKWLYLSGILELTESITKQFHNAYLKRLEYLDAQIGKTITILKKSGLLDDANVVIASDHGQFFGEHGLLYHSLYPYSEVTRVPLIISKFENGKQVSSHTEINEPTSLMDLHGMLLSMSGYKHYAKKNAVISEHNSISEGWDGQLLSSLRRRSSYADRIYKAKLGFNTKSYSVIKDGYKLIHFFAKRKSELYKVTDYAEENDILSSNRSIAKRLLMSID